MFGFDKYVVCLAYNGWFENLIKGSQIRYSGDEDMCGNFTENKKV